MPSRRLSSRPTVRSAVAQQFLEEVLVDDPQVGAFDEVLRKARVARKFLDDAGAFFGRERIAFEQAEAYSPIANSSTSLRKVLSGVLKFNLS